MGRPTPIRTLKSDPKIRSQEAAAVSKSHRSLKLHCARNSLDEEGAREHLRDPSGEAEFGTIRALEFVEWKAEEFSCQAQGVLFLGYMVQLTMSVSSPSSSVVFHGLLTRAEENRQDEGTEAVEDCYQIGLDEHLV